MTDKELMQQALDALEIACDRHGTVGGAQTDWGKWDAAAHALRARLAQPEQEPVAWMSQGGDVSRSRKHFKEMGFTNLIPLYTTPPQREWVGLTGEVFDEKLFAGFEVFWDVQARIGNVLGLFVSVHENTPGDEAPSDHVLGKIACDP